MTATRYVTPLREGGSLPGVMEADDLGTYVVKYTGAGQGPPVLMVEVVAGQIARGLGLPVPELVVVEVDPVLGRVEPDEEVQDLLRASPGPNLGIDLLPRALGFDPNAHRVDPLLASQVLWFDALVGNVDRSWRNPNLLIWHGELWMIDHGATLVFAFDLARAATGGWADRPYPVEAHVLAEQATQPAEAAARMSERLDEDLIRAAVAAVPDAWVGGGEPVRETLVEQLLRRLERRERWQP